MKMLIRYSWVALLALLADSPVTPTQSPTSQNGFVLVPIPATAVHHRPQAAPRIRNKNGTSGNWAGYAIASNLRAPLSGVVTEVQGTWTVPSVSASESTDTYSSNWIGIDGYSDNTVEQTGTEHDMTPDGPVYYAWFEMYPKSGYRILNFPVEPGDTITAEVRYAGNNRYRLTISNLSRNATFSTTQRTKARRQSAEWIVEAPYSGGTLPLADFGTTAFSGCSATLGGHAGAISDSNWQHEEITMAEQNGAVKAQTSGLSSSGTGFSVSWQHE